MSEYDLYAVRIQKAVRGWLVRQEVERLIKAKREKAATTIQTGWFFIQNNLFPHGLLIVIKK